MAEYISVDQLFKCETCFHYQNGKCNLWCDATESYRPAYNKLKKVDAVEVVRCKECKLRDTEDCFVAFWYHGELVCYTEDNDFCSRGERKEN